MDPQGDYTRTGERKFTGLMKDGMNSANRFVGIVLWAEMRRVGKGRFTFGVNAKNFIFSFHFRIRCRSGHRRPRFPSLVSDIT